MNAIMSWLTACGRSALCFVMMFLSTVVLTACPPPDDCLRIANPLVGAQQVEPPFWLKTNGGEVYRLRDGSFIIVSTGQSLEDKLKTMEECEPITIVFSTETPTEMTSTPAAITTPTATSTETATTTADQTTPTPIPVTPTVIPAEVTSTQTPTPIVDPATFTPTPVSSSPTAEPTTPTTASSIDDDGDGYTVAAGDCNDHDSSINPEADEFCDGIDSDCDWVIDEEPIEGGVPLYFDYDFDGVGGDQVINYNVCYFELPGPIWFSFVTGDCNDEDPDVYPGALELSDGEDNDCDGEIDEGLDEVSPTPAPTPEVTATPVMTETETPTPTQTPSDTPTSETTPSPSESCSTLVGYDYVTTPNVEHPDDTFTGDSDYGLGQLFDGSHATSANYTDTNWVAWRKSIEGDAVVIWQFDRICMMREITLSLLISETDGIYLPSIIQVSTSDDGVTFNDSMSYAPSPLTGQADVALPVYRSARYFRVTIVQSAQPESWVFWDETHFE